jgi:hypothetical protein
MMKANILLGTLASASALLIPTPASSAITVGVAKKCTTLTAKGFPPRVVGNPAAGSGKGSAATSAIISQTV